MKQTPYAEAIPLGSVQYSDSADPRCPCVLVLDRSGSMSGAPIEQLNVGLQKLRFELLKHELAARRVEIAVIPFGPVVRQSSFQSAKDFRPETLRAGGDTPTGAAIEYAIDLIELQKRTYKRNNVRYYRPWIIILTDGQPTDDWLHAARRIHEGEAAWEFSFFAVGVRGADMDLLRRLSVRESLRLQGLAFSEFFVWLSSSLANVSNSPVGEAVALPLPSAWSSD